MTISRTEFEERTRRLREKMKANELDALIVFADEYRPGHATYLTGYKPLNMIEESPQLVFLVGDRPPVVLIGRLNSYAAKEILWTEDVRPIHRAEEFILWTLDERVAVTAGRLRRVADQRIELRSRLLESDHHAIRLMRADAAEGTRLTGRLRRRSTLERRSPLLSPTT